LLSQNHLHPSLGSMNAGRRRQQELRSEIRWIGRSASPGRTEARYSRTGIFNLRQLSTIERIAAIFGPACALPIWIQFRRPRATGRIEFSARLLLNSNFGYSRKRVSLFQRVSVQLQALASAPSKQCRGAGDFDLLLDHTQLRSRLLADAEHGGPIQTRLTLAPAHSSDVRRCAHQNRAALRSAVRPAIQRPARKSVAAPPAVS